MSNAIQNDGGSAYPSYRKGASYPHDLRPIGGMSLRDYFAAAALPASWDAFDKGYWTCETEDINRTVAEGAYQMADAMLAAREAK